MDEGLTRRHHRPTAVPLRPEDFRTPASVRAPTTISAKARRYPPIIADTFADKEVRRALFSAAYSKRNLFRGRLWRHRPLGQQHLQRRLVPAARSRHRRDRRAPRPPPAARLRKASRAQHAGEPAAYQTASSANQLPPACRTACACRARAGRSPHLLPGQAHGRHLVTLDYLYIKLDTAHGKLPGPMPFSRASARWQSPRSACW